MGVFSKDLAIVGAGPAALSAAIYAARAGLSCVVFEELIVGGQLASIDLLENYPGFPRGVSGYEMAFSLKEQAEKFGAEIRSDKVEALIPEDGKFVLQTSGETCVALSVIIATGAKPKKLDTPDVSAFEGRGVSYCATCDGNFYAGKNVVIVGGGDSAAADALYLSRICSEVHLVHRRDTLRASHWHADKIGQSSNIKVHWDSVLTSLEEKDGYLGGVTITNLISGAQRFLECSGLFIAIGTLPETTWLSGVVDRDERGYIVTNSNCETSLAGVFAAGDVRTTSLRQVVTAAADGALAAEAAVKFLQEH